MFFFFANVRQEKIKRRREQKKYKKKNKILLSFLEGGEYFYVLGKQPKKDIYMHTTTSLLYERIETNREERVGKNSNQKEEKIIYQFSNAIFLLFSAKLFAFYSQTNFDKINSRYICDVTVSALKLDLALRLQIEDTDRLPLCISTVG